MIRLQVLGSLALSRADETSIKSVLSQPKRFALLTILASSYPAETHSRDTLVGLLWPDLAPDRARRALRQALHGLRRSLGPGVVTGKGRELQGIDPEALWCDAAAFSRTLDEGHPEAALDLYRGDFLEGFHVSGVPAFERWVDRRRRRLRLAAVDVAWRVAEQAEAEGSRPEARRAAERAMGLAPFDGEGVRRYLRLMDRLGRPAAGIRTYRAYESRLRDEMDLEPSAETRELVNRIRDSDSPAAAESGEDPEVQAIPDNRARSGDDGVPASEKMSGEMPSTGPGSHLVSAPEDRGNLPASSVSLSDWLDRGTLPAVLAVALVVSLSVFGLFRSSEARSSGVVEPIRSVAVLPFDDLSPEHDQRWLGDGVAEEILSRLGTVEGLDVAARSSSFRFGGASPEIWSVGESLGVGAVIEGSVQRVGDRIRITVHLVSTSDARALWSETFDREFSTEAIFDIQDAVARSVAEALRVELDLEDPHRFSGAPTADMEAYSLYLRASHAVRERTVEGRRRARLLLLEAVGRDPEFASAWALLAMLRAQGPFWEGYLDSVDFGESRALALEAAERAVDLDPGLAEAHTMLGFVLSQQHRWERAEEHLERAMALNPSDAMARGAWLWQLASNGHWERALEQARIRQRLDPLYTPANGNLAGMLMYSGRLSEARTAWRRTIEMAGSNDAQADFLRSLQAKAFALDGRMEEAVATARRAYRQESVRYEPGESYYISQLAAMYGLAGRSEAAEALLDDLRDRRSSEVDGTGVWLRSFDLARVHAARGRADSAFIWLERSRPDRWRTLEIARFRGDPWWAPIRADPRYQGILGKIGVDSEDGDERR